MTEGRPDGTDSLLAEILPAVRFYEGAAGNSFLPEGTFDEETRNAPKAYITINTLLGDDTTEKSRFMEGKRQVSGLITPEGIGKILELYKGFYRFCVRNPAASGLRLCAMKRCSEVEAPFIGALMSTTKMTPGEIYALGYGNKVGLALCYYTLAPGALAFDYEKMGGLYTKKQEREVLLMPGNGMKIKKLGSDSRFPGKDGLPAEVFEIEVTAPDFDIILQDDGGCEDIVFDPGTLKIVRAVYEEINRNIGGEFPAVPDGYREWKHAFRRTVYSALRDIYHNSAESPRLRTSV